MSRFSTRSTPRTPFAALTLLALFCVNTARAATFPVTKLADTTDGACDADCSFREAIQSANSTAGKDTITFAAGVTGTIQLSSVLPNLTSNMDIVGPGASSLSVRGEGLNDPYRILNVLSGNSVTISGLTLSNGNADGVNAATFGGCIYSRGTLTINDCVLSGSIAGTSGGAICSINGILRVNNSTISGNHALNGGAIVSQDGSLTITGCTLSGNSASLSGGGIFSLVSAGSVSVTSVRNSTLSGNSASSIGGGIYNSGGTIFVETCTITDNSAQPGSGSGVASYSYPTASTLVYNSIIAGNINSDVDYVNGSSNGFQSNNYNLIGTGNATSVFVEIGDTTGITDPGLGALASNGGPTQTHAVLTSSPAFDKGDPGYTFLTTDQRGAGYEREQGSQIDIGAFEAQPALSIANATIIEGNTGSNTAMVTVTLSPFAAETVTVQYATEDGTALQPTDYTAASGTLTFAPGDTTKTISIPIIGDALDEDNETFKVNLSAAINADLGLAQGTITINDNDAAPSLTITDTTFTEGTLTANATFTVTLSAVSGRTVTVNYTTADGTAHQPDDYTLRSGTFTFTPGQTTKSLTVAVRGDLIDEDDETFKVNLSAAVGANIGDSQGVCTILDDDTSTATINDVTVVENDSGPKNLKFTVTLSNPNSRTVTVDYATADGTAKAGSDYNALIGTVTFSIGQTIKTFIVESTGDLLDENNETFFANLSNATNATITDAQGVGTINDDELAPSISISDTNDAEGDSGTNFASFNVTLSEVSGRDVSVNYATVHGTAKEGEDYENLVGTVTIPAGQLSAQVLITVIGDTVFEDNETFKVNLSGASGANISRIQAICTILNDDLS